MAYFNFYSSSRQCLLLLLAILLFFSDVDATPVDSLGSASDTSQNYSEGTLFYLTALSVCSLITLIVVLLACGAGGCCSLPKIHWFGRSSRPNVPMSFENPVADMGNAMPLSQIDVRALELDPVVFEPLPTIHDLSPLNQFNSTPNIGEFSNGGGVRGENAILSVKNPSAVVIPFATEDSDLYAHDWFDESYRNFPRNNLEYIREVGKGWFGQVLEAEAKDIVPFAAKIRVIVRLLREEASQIDQMRFLDECRVYRDANQGNILKLLGHSIEKLPFLLIMEHCPQGDLKSYLISNVTRAEMLSSQGIVLKMASDIAKGLEWMMNADLKHHDLAARNCQVAGEGRIIIGDYGLATHAFRDDYYWNSDIPIPLRWAAPETLHCTPTTIQTLKVTKLSNIWSYAVVLWEIIEFGKLPYFELSDEEVITRVLADKNYFLGQPTLPYIPFKTELYEVMRACWSIDPRHRPSMSLIVSKLQALQDSLDSKIKSNTNKDEFDSKWEQLGRLSSSSFETEDNKGKPGNISKKSVSFTGIASSLLEEEALPFDIEQGRAPEGQQVDLSKTDRHGPEDRDEEDCWVKGIERGDIAQKVLEKSQSVQGLMVLTHVEPGDLDPDSLIYNVNNPDTPVTQSETSQRGGESNCSSYTRSTSVLGTPDSESRSNNLNSTSFTSCVESPSSSRIQHPNAGPNTFVVTDLHSLSSSSDTNVASEHVNWTTTNSSDMLTIPEISVQPSTPGTTPNKTSIDINVIEATPNPDSGVRPNPKSNAQPLEGQKNQSARRVVFDFGDSPAFIPPPVSKLNGKDSQRRHTSTPKRSESSPLPLINDLNGSLEDVFENENSFNDSCNVSPIRIKRSGAVFHPGELVTSIVLGASDELGLNVFQGVTSHAQDSSNQFDSNDSSEDGAEILYPTNFQISSTQSPPSAGECTSSMEDDSPPLQGIPITDKNASATNGHQSPFGDNIKILSGDIKKGQPLTLTPRPGVSKLMTRKPNLMPRVLFSGTVDTDSETSTINNSISTQLDNESTLSGVQSVSDVSVWDVVNTSSAEKEKTESSSWDVISNIDLNSTNKNTESTSISTPEQCNQLLSSTPPNSDITNADGVDEMDNFLNRQMQSLSNAAYDTKSLFALSLREARTASETFVEDINAANDELGSLVYEDLDEQNISQKIVPESRQLLNGSPPDKKAKVRIAFVGNPLNKNKSSDSLLDPTSSTSVLPWDSEVQDSNAESNVNVTDDNFESTGDIVVNETVEASLSLSRCKDFVPSTWNQSLAPSRPAIKSPSAIDFNAAQQVKSSLKKSVSFERKKAQVVYEYPPPPPASDSEEDSHICTNTKIPTIPLSSSLDWELTQEELEFAEINQEDSDEEVTVKSDPMDMYRISGFGDIEESFRVRPSSEPFVFQPQSSTLGELRHTRDKLKLDLCRGEASLLDEDTSRSTVSSIKQQQLDSGVGSSTNVSPFVNCDDSYSSNLVPDRSPTSET